MEEKLNEIIKLLNEVNKEILVNAKGESESAHLHRCAHIRAYEAIMAVGKLKESINKCK